MATHDPYETKEVYPAWMTVVTAQVSFEVSPKNAPQGRPKGNLNQDDHNYHNLPVVDQIAAICAPITMVQSFYMLVNDVALARGSDPDNPPLLRKVTETV